MHYYTLNMNLKKAIKKATKEKIVITSFEDAWKQQRYFGYRNPRLKLSADKYVKKLIDYITPSEQHLVNLLQDLQIEYNLQAVILTANAKNPFYILDIYIPSYHVYIECDGWQHYTKLGLLKDKKRNTVLKKLGFPNLIRLQNSDALLLNSYKLQNYLDEFIIS